MPFTCESPLAIALLQTLPARLKAHSYSIMELAQELAQDFDCPLCEILTPMGEALSELSAVHCIEFDPAHNRVLLAC